MTRRSRIWSVLVALLMASCTTPTSKFGGDMVPVVLRAGAGSAADGPGGDLLAHLAEEAEQSTNGALHLAVDSALESGGIDQDLRILQRLQDGELDIGVIRAPTFSSVGLTSFQALQAPFLIDNDELAQRVSADPIAKEMLDRLDTIDLVGLALVPGGLRHPVGWHQPLLSLQDYQGAVINSRPSPDVDRLFAALGASTDHSVGQERITNASRGLLRGLDMSLLIHPSDGAPAALTTNVVLYTQFDVLAIRREAFAGLSSRQRAALEAALTRTVKQTQDSRPAEAAAAHAWCELPGQATVAARPEDLAMLRAAGTVLIDQLRKDAFTARVLDRINSLAVGTRLAELPICAGPPGPSISVSPRGDQRVLDGTWRFDTTSQDLLDAGVPANEVDKDVGVHTYVFRNGRLTGGKQGEHCTGSYVVDDPRFAWSFDPTSCGGSFQATYALEGDHMVLNIDPMTLDGWFFRGYLKNGLVRIGDLP